MAFCNLRRYFTFLALCVLAALPAAAQVSAGFTVSAPVPNCNPAIYSFTNTSTGTGTLHYQWNFGVYPGVNSVFQNPSTTYLGCGSFTVTLIAINSQGQRDTAVQTVNIRCSPVADFISSGLSGCIPFATNFTSTSSPGSGTIASYVWDFGDGISSNSSSPGHTYYQAGCKNVTLIVTNTYGCTKDTTITNVLCTYSPPASDFTSSATTSCTYPFNVNYQANSSSGLQPYTYQWLFEGGTPATSNLASPSITYNKPGTFSTSLITTDANGCSDTMTKELYISVGQNTANFTLTDTVACVPAVIAATGISNATVQSWSWSSTPAVSTSGSNSQTPAFSFSDTGSYNICLQINYGSGCIAQKCTSLVAHRPPVAGFNINGPSKFCQAPDTVSFTNTSSGEGLTYLWSLPGAYYSYSTTLNATAEYEQCGEYTVALTVRDKYGCSAAYNAKNLVNINCPSTNFTAAPQFGCLPITTVFTGPADSNVVSWFWNFGDTLSGNPDTSTAANPTYTYTYPGCYTVSLTTVNSAGCVSSKVMPDEVCGGHRPHANFSGNPPQTCADKPVLFTDSSTDTYSYTTYVWDFHGGPPFLNESNQKNPSYIYNQIGTYTVTEIVANYGCADTITKDDYVQTVVPIAYPKAIQTCNNKLTVTLDGTGSTGAQSYLWTIPNGTPSSDTNAIVSVTFPASGTYSASLFVLNDSTGCSDLQPVTINISNLQAEFTAAPLSACNTLSAQFSNTSTGAAGYSWTITNQAGAFAEWSTNFLPYVLLKTPGIYNVMLIVNDSLGCKDTLIRPHYLSVDQPVAAFKAQPRDGCAPSEINMTDMSTYPLVPGKTWSWNFGDSISGGNNVSSLENPAHLYQNAGTYTVSLSIVDSEGCTANTTMLNYIQVNKPLAAFTYTSTSTCQAATICFDNTSTGQLLKYLWNFGDSTTSTATAPCHSYTTDGTYNMALIVTDSIGCKDTLTQASNVNLVVPHPNFVADTTHSSCPPLVVNFTNLSSDTNAQTTYLWNFGDGQVSSQLNPLHIYNIPGTFTVSLIAKRNGCSDTVIFTNYIFIGGPSGYAFNTPSSGCAPHNVCFSAKSSSTVSYAWNFGDGTVTPGPDSICYIYSRPGTFYPQLILTDTGGCVFAQPLGQVNISIATALFGMDSVLRCNAASVNFTDSSSGVPGIQSWSWNFGDTASRAGNISVQQNPSHYFAAPGNYQVQELVTDSAGCMDSLTRILQVTSPPAVTFAMVNPPACFSDTVFFTDQTNANANVISRMWNFGDASSGKLDTSSQVNPRHWYNVVGNYTVTLIDMSSSGCADTLKEVITMHAKPTSAFTAQNRCVNEQPISFSNGSQGASAYQWLFGDGQASVQASPQHNYASSGQYNVTLIANNGFCYDTITLPVQVYALPSSSLSLSSPYSCGNPALLNVSDQSTNIVSQFWNFGDAASGKADTSSLLNASHTYAAQGNYSVMLVTKNSNGCSDTALVKFAVYPKPVASFTVANACLNTQPIAFTNTSVGSTAYSWLFGDGDSSTLQNPVHTYQAASKYNVRLISTVEYCADTFHAPVEIYDVPGASVSLSATTFCGTPAVLSGNYGNSGGINYYWNFGDDGSGASDTSVLQNAVHRYNNAGNYTVTFITSNANGCADTSRQTVHVAATPSGTFSAMDTCLNTQPIVFSNYISNATSYTWYFGDGDSSAARSPAHTYKEAGQYVVTLVASDNTCADTLTAPVKIYALPAAAFTLSSSGMCGPPAVVSTTNNSSSANSYLWNFGNGDTSAASNPVISYSTAGTFQITLTAMNGSCRDMASDSFSVTPAPIVQGIDVAAAGGCAPVRVNFTANAPGADSYTWNFGDSSASFTSSSPNAAYTYNDTGSFTISLYVISGNGCRDSAILTDTVQVHIQPIADFDTLIYSDNYPFNGNVIFVNLSQNADNYLWEFGDGATSTDFNPQHEYGQVDTFNATLIASTNYGCVDSATRSFFVIKKALYVPNALRPDANGSEELVKVWKPLGIGLSAYHAEIYDKWGTLLWQSDSLQNTQPSESWDGTYHGQPCQQDAYVWKISATFVDGTPWPGMTYDVSEGGGTKTLGSVTLIR